MSQSRTRFFKTKMFAKLATKAQILDVELLRVGADLALGKGDNLGGNVWKKRLNKNMHRSVVIRKAVGWWFFFYLYAKNARDNIDQAEVTGFKLLAAQYAAMSEEQLRELLTMQEILEIVGDDDQTPIQK